MKCVATACALVLLAVQSGCGRSLPTWQLPEPPTEDVRRSVTRLAVILEGDPLGFPAPPLAGACSMAAVGMLIGMSYGAVPGLQVVSALRGVHGGGQWAILIVLAAVGVGLALLAVFVPLGGLVGGIVGSFYGRSAEEVERGRVVLQRAADGAGVPEAIREDVLDVLSRETDLRVVDRASADALMVIGRPSLGLAGPRRLDPPLKLYGEIRFRLLRGRDGAELHAFTLGFASEARSWDDWTAEEGTLPRAELTRGTSLFAERAVEEFFLLERSPR